MSDDDVDVVVVGAGPTGLALALQVHDHGARVRVVERRPEQVRPSRALIVHPRTLEALRPLGVSDELMARGDVAPSVHLHLGQREIPVQLGGFDLRDSAFPHLLFVPQMVVEEVLARALAHRGLEVERGVELVDRTAVDVDRPGVVVRRGRSIERISCTYVAGCDGANSTVRRLAGVSSRGRRYRQEVVLADVELDDGPTLGAAHAIAGRPGLLFLFSTGEHATWRMLATRAGADDEVTGGQPGGAAVPAEELQALLDGVGLSSRIADVGWSTRVRLEHRIASHYRRGGLFVVGDAAHVHSPAGGQGMNTGIQDALNLGWKLAFAAATGSPSAACRPLLDSYEKERRPVAQQVRALTHALFWAEAGTGPVASFARGALAPLAGGAVPSLLRPVPGGTGGPMAVAAARPLPGQPALRCRNVPATRRSSARGAPARLVDHDHGPAAPAARAVGRPGLPRAARPRRACADGTPRRLVRVHRVSSWPGHGIVIVRPDGYIGFAAATVATREVTDWLRLVGAEIP